MHLTATREDAHDAHETEELPLVSLADLPRASFTLRIVAGPNIGSTLTLDAASPPHAILGQAEGSALELADPHVSRKHVSITATASHLVLSDLGSRNGTKVNGVRVREARLYGGELVTIGGTTIGIETDRATAANSESTMPPPPPSSHTVAKQPSDFFASVLAEKLPFTEARQRTVAEFEKRYVEDCLDRHQGNVTHAARASGLAHRYFQLVRARSR